MAAAVPGFEDACLLLDAALSGGARAQILDGVSPAKDLRQALTRLRDGLRTHIWKPGGRSLTLETFVDAYDREARSEGFHALHDWDGKADRSNADTIPIDMLNFIIDQRGGGAVDRPVLAILLDYYFLYLLCLLSLRIWRDGDAGENLDRLTALVRRLQGPDGSGQKFVDDAETLLIISTAHFELDDRCYDILLDRVRALDEAHQLTIGIGHAAALGSHLRYGFEATYNRDWKLMRDDNGVDYRWLAFGVTAAVRGYERAASGDPASLALLTEAIVNGFTADPEVLTGAAHTDALAAWTGELAELRDRVHAHRDTLLPAFEQARPLDDAYSPIALFFNFSHNILKGTVADALLFAEPWDLSLNDLFSGSPRGDGRGQAKQTLARTLMGYARTNPDTVRGKPMPAIVYDPPTARRSFAGAMKLLAR